MQDAKRPLLSIFVSVYNLESYIEQCLDSILQQPFQDYEILLFDNGSIDRSIEICTGYAQRYPDKSVITSCLFPLWLAVPTIWPAQECGGAILCR